MFRTLFAVLFITLLPGISLGAEFSLEVHHEPTETGVDTGSVPTRELSANPQFNALWNHSNTR